MKTSDRPHLVFLTMFLQLRVIDHWFFTQFRNHYIDRWIARNKQLIIRKRLSFSVSLQIQQYYYWNRNSSSFPWLTPHMKCTSDRNRWSNKSWSMVFECLFAWCDHPKFCLYSYLCGHVIEIISVSRKWHTVILQNCINVLQESRMTSIYFLKA